MMIYAAQFTEKGAAQFIGILLILCAVLFVVFVFGQKILRALPRKRVSVHAVCGNITKVAGKMEMNGLRDKVAMGNAGVQIEHYKVSFIEKETQKERSFAVSPELAIRFAEGVEGKLTYAGGTLISFVAGEA